MTFRLNNWSGIVRCSSDRLPFYLLTTSSWSFAGVVKISNNSKWQNPFANITWADTRASKSLYGNLQDPRKFHILCCGVKIALYPGLNSLEWEKKFWGASKNDLAGKYIIVTCTACCEDRPKNWFSFLHTLLMTDFGRWCKPSQQEWRVVTDLSVTYKNLQLYTVVYMYMYY